MRGHPAGSGGTERSAALALLDDTRASPVSRCLAVKRFPGRDASLRQAPTLLPRRRRRTCRRSGRHRIRGRPSSPSNPGRRGGRTWGRRRARRGIEDSGRACGSTPCTESRRPWPRVYAFRASGLCLPSRNGASRPSSRPSG